MKIRTWRLSTGDVLHDRGYHMSRGALKDEHGAMVEQWSSVEYQKELGENLASMALYLPWILHEVTRDWNSGSPVRNWHLISYSEVKPFRSISLKAI
jgi:hypothetical protein